MKFNEHNKYYTTKGESNVWIVRQDGKGAVKVTEIEISHNRFYGISEKGKEVLLGEYDSQEETDKVLNTFINALRNRREIISMPSRRQIKG